MKWHYLRTFLWLKWRLRANQMKRAGSGSVILQRILQILFVITASVAFVIFLAVGVSGPRSPLLMLVWDGIVAGFLLFWMTELLVELQRSEMLSLDRFLHLPVSLSGVFLINFIGSALNPSLIMFVVASIGFTIGLVISKGAMMLLLFPLVLAFALALTALTYQFRGWLASLMVNKRRRRTIVTIATLGFVLMFQIPNFIGMSRGWGRNPRERISRDLRDESRRLEQSRASGSISADEYESAMDEAYKKHGVEREKDVEDVGLQDLDETVTTVNRIVPAGWLPYGARRLSEGSSPAALLGAVGLVLIGGASLRRSYRTTVRLYTGQFTSTGRRKSVPTVAGPAAPKQETTPKATVRPSVALMEKQLPGVSEHASAVAVAAFRSMMRAPETKLLLLSPIILVVVFGSMFLRQAQNPSVFIRPLMTAGTMAMILLTLVQLAGNQFGFDRSGFRTLVLSPASRRDILLGKNLALFPLALGLAAVIVVAMQFLSPMRLDHFAAALIQMISMYAMFCIITNYLSILAPTPVASGSLKPVKPKGLTILLHLAFVFFLFPAAMASTMMPLAIEFGLRWYGTATWFPAYLVFAIVELGLVSIIYPAVLRSQGRLLQAREQKILEVVTVKVE